MSIKTTFRSLETDEELRARLMAAGVSVSYERGVELEERAWNSKRMERRLLWRSA